jgi:hypothetical protein
LAIELKILIEDFNWASLADLSDNPASASHHHEIFSGGRKNLLDPNTQLDPNRTQSTRFEHSGSNQARAFKQDGPGSNKGNALWAMILST